jgi:hypothetical protein
MILPISTSQVARIIGISLYLFMVFHLAIVSTTQTTEGKIVN